MALNFTVYFEDSSENGDRIATTYASDGERNTVSTVSTISSTRNLLTHIIEVILEQSESCSVVWLKSKDSYNRTYKSVNTLDETTYINQLMGDMSRFDGNKPDKGTLREVMRKLASPETVSGWSVTHSRFNFNFSSAFRQEPNVPSNIYRRIDW